MIEQVIHKKLMGTAFTLGVIAATTEQADSWLQEGVTEIKRIESLLSEYTSDSIVAQINHASVNQAIALPPEVFQLIKRCLDIASLTNGCFDITAGTLKRLYSFTKQEAVLPSDQEIKTSLQSVGSKKLRLNIADTSIKKLVPNMHISLNAVGKGYAADAVKQLWLRKGITAGYINASGDLSVFGKKRDKNSWNVAIADPDDITRPLLHIPLLNQAMATSGDAEQYFMHNGKKYSHNINPLTGKPLAGVKSVSVISPSAELSDALATAVYVMGKKRGLDFVNQLPQTYAVIIDDKNQISFSEKLTYESFNS